MTIAEVHQRFTSGPIRCVEGQGDLPCLDIATDLAEARIYLHGAHLAHFQPRGQQPVLFMSDASLFRLDKPIRGGVPVCFPWFGPKPDDPQAPAHGFARLQTWSLVSADVLPTGEVQVILELLPSDLSRGYGFDAFALEYRVRVGRELSLTLTVRNTGAAPFTISEALHTYFSVGDVHKVNVAGLSGVTYLDKTQNLQRFTEGPNPISITQETDRHYLNTDATAVLHDPSLSRRIVISKAGSLSTVLWNPWIAKAKAMSDFGNEEWPRMLCIETANAADNALTIAPQQSHGMRATIRAERP
jgi:glucose-6-phosphate 1-epimerase